MNNCGCNPIQEKFEFPIIDIENISTITNSSSLIDDYNPSCSNNDICELKKKIVLEFKKILKQLECGIQPDLEFLLQEMSLVYISNDRILFK